MEARHVVETSRLLMQRSMIISQRVATGECAIACVTYKLAEGEVKLQRVVGNIGELA
jgi:carbonic anhydrase